MIKGLHGLFYTPQAQTLRAFLRDKLGLAYTDAGEGWLVFDLAEGDLGVHPSDHTYHSISFYCDDIFTTVEILKSRGVEFTSGISDREWGWSTTLRMPGEIEVELYEPKYKKNAENAPKIAEAEQTKPRKNAKAKPRKVAKTKTRKGLKKG